MPIIPILIKILGVLPWGKIVSFILSKFGSKDDVKKSVLENMPDDLPVLNWMEIAEKEIGIKEIVGKKHNTRIVEYHSKTGYGAKTDEVPWCLKGNVEILTPEGWIRFDRLEGQKVAQVSTNTHKISFVDPIRKIKKQYNGLVYEINRRGLKGIVCDKDHEWYGQWSGTKNNNGSPKPFMKKKLGELTSILGLPATSYEQDDNQHVSDKQLQFLAAFISDGSYIKSSKHHNWRVQFQVSREYKIDRLREFDPAHEYTAPKPYGKSKKPLTSLEFAMALDDDMVTLFDAAFDQYKVLKWDWVFSLSSRQMNVFMDEYALFDGHSPGPTSQIVYTSHEEIKERLITMIALSGNHVTSVQPRDDIGFSKKTNFAIRWDKNKVCKNIRPDNVKSYHSELELFCVEVPTGLILCRDPHGHPFVTGNCSSFIVWVFEKANIPSTRSAAARSWTEWGKHCELKRGAVITLWRISKTSPAGHVGLYWSEHPTDPSRFMMLSGNSSNQVRISSYLKDRIIDSRWPEDK